MILLPGVLSSRVSRISQLSFGWDAKDCSLIARTGQPGRLTSLGFSGTGGAFTPSAGVALVSGRAQPRFSRVGLINALDLSQTTTGQDGELLTYSYAMGPQSLTILLTLTPTWAAGATRTVSQSVFGLGDLTVGGTRITINRTAAPNWQVNRSVPGTGSSTNAAESAGMTFPLDLLVTYNHATHADQIQVRGANGTTTASSVITGVPAITERWSGETLTLGSEPFQKLGAPIRLHACKIALGVKTFAQMDALA